MRGQTRAPDAPLFLWPGPWKGRLILQALGTLSNHAAAGEGTLSSCLICAQGRAPSLTGQLLLPIL